MHEPSEILLYRTICELIHEGPIISRGENHNIPDVHFWGINGKICLTQILWTPNQVGYYRRASINNS